MSRNYQNENKWLKENYKRIEIRVPKKDGEKFIELLKEKGKTVNRWGNEQIQNYLKNNLTN